MSVDCTELHFCKVLVDLEEIIVDSPVVEVHHCREPDGLALLELKD